MSEQYYNAFPKPPKREKKQPKPLQSKPKNTGQAAMFREIWEERVHECSHCREWLGNEINYSFFDHILTKKQRKDLRLEKDNIRLLCFDCHFIRHNMPMEKFEARKKV